jgi:hypothetical protein
MARGRLVAILVLSVIAAIPVTARRAFAKHGHPSNSPADQAQVRELLSKLAAASGTPEPEERTDADLMYEAMLRWNGEPAGSAAVDRLIDSSKKAAARAKKQTQETVRRMFWKDPFADDPQKLVLVRQEDRDLLDSYQRRKRRTEVRVEAREPREARESNDARETEMTRLRRELAAARAEAEEARAESERIRARAEHQQANSCVADESGAEVRKRRRVSGSSFHSRGSDRARSEQQVALATTAPAASYTPPPPPPVSMPAEPVPAHGIIITPLPSPPSDQPVVEARRHGRSH